MLLPLPWLDAERQELRSLRTILIGSDERFGWLLCGPAVTRPEGCAPRCSQSYRRSIFLLRLLTNDDELLALVVVLNCGFARSVVCPTWSLFRRTNSLHPSFAICGALAMIGRAISRSVSTLAKRDSVLFTPGPLTTSLEVKQAMLRDYGSRDPIFLEVRQA